MALTIETIREITQDSNPYKLYIYKSLDYISTEDLTNIDPRDDESKFIDVLKIGDPLLYEYQSDGSTKFIVMALYKIMNDTGEAILSTVFRTDDYYDSSLFTKMKIGIVVTGIIDEEFTISQINVEMLDHNNRPLDEHGIGEEQGELVTPTLVSVDPNKIHYDKELTTLIRSIKFLNPLVDASIQASNVIVDNNIINKRVAYVNRLQEGETPIIYTPDYVGQILSSANVLDANTMKSLDILRCDGSFVDIEEYPELYNEIGDLYLFNLELWAKVVEVGGTVVERKFSDLNIDELESVVELFYNRLNVDPIEGKFKLPLKEYLGYQNNHEYYIKARTTMNTFNAKLLKNINGVGIINNSISLTTTDIPQGDKLYYNESYLDPLKNDIKSISDKIPTQPVLKINDKTPNEDGNVTLTASDVGGIGQDQLNNAIENIGLNNYLDKSVSINLDSYSEYEEVLDETDPDDIKVVVSRYRGFHIDSKDIFYEKDETKNPNDPSYTPQTLFDYLKTLGTGGGSGGTGTGTGDLLSDGSVSMTGNLNVGNNKIVNLADPVDNGDAVNLKYINANSLKIGDNNIIGNRDIFTGYYLASSGSSATELVNIRTNDIEIQTETSRIGISPLTGIYYGKGPNNRQILNFLNRTWRSEGTSSNIPLTDNTLLVKKDLESVTLSSSYSPTDNNQLATKGYVDSNSTSNSGTAVVEIPISIVGTVTIYSKDFNYIPLGNPNLIKGTGGYLEYISNTSGIIKIKKLSKTVKISGLILSNLFSSVQEPKEFEILLLTPSEDILGRFTAVKTRDSTEVDFEFSFNEHHIVDANHPLVTDGFQLRFINYSSSDMNLISTRVGTLPKASLRILFID